MKDPEAAEARTNFVLAVLVIPIAVLSYPLRAWAIITLWGWFIEPTWHVAVPGKAAACGLSILFGLFSADAAHDMKPLDSIVRIWLGPVFAVAFGWIVRWWLT